MKEHCACQLPIVAPGRRAFLAALPFTAVSPTVALTQTGGSGAAADVRFMRMALEDARQADFAFGAVIVREGSVIALGRILGRATVEPTAHGEMGAIRT